MKSTNVRLWSWEPQVQVFRISRFNCERNRIVEQSKNIERLAEPIMDKRGSYDESSDKTEQK